MKIFRKTLLLGVFIITIFSLSACALDDVKEDIIQKDIRNFIEKEEKVTEENEEIIKEDNEPIFIIQKDQAFSDSMVTFVSKNTYDLQNEEVIYRIKHSEDSPSIRTFIFNDFLLIDRGLTIDDIISIDSDGNTLPDTVSPYLYGHLDGVLSKTTTYFSYVEENNEGSEDLFLVNTREGTSSLIFLGPKASLDISINILGFSEDEKTLFITKTQKDLLSIYQIDIESEEVLAIPVEIEDLDILDVVAFGSDIYIVTIKEEESVNYELSKIDISTGELSSLLNSNKEISNIIKGQKGLYMNLGSDIAFMAMNTPKLLIDNASLMKISKNDTHIFYQKGDSFSNGSSILVYDMQKNSSRKIMGLSEEMDPNYLFIGLME